MSHFPVLVVGGNVEEQLEPFCEDLDLEEERVYLTAADRATMARAYGVADPDDLHALLPHVEDWVDAEGAIDDDGIYYIRSFNSNAKWDWYELGGRWTGFLHLKPGRTGTLSVSSGGLDPDAPVRDLTGRADQARKGDIDFAGMRRAAAADAEDRWQTYRTAIHGTPRPTLWPSFVTRVNAGVMSLDAARAAFHAQPRVAAFERALPFEEIENFAGSRREYLRRTSRIGRTIFAYLYDDEWHAQGDMGWFGIATNTTPLDVWSTEIEDMLAALSDDALLTVVDCHI